MAHYGSDMKKVYTFYVWILKHIEIKFYNRIYWHCNTYIFLNLFSLIFLNEYNIISIAKIFCFAKWETKKPRIDKARSVHSERESSIAVLPTTKLSGTRRPRTRERILFRAVSVPCGQQGSRQYLCRRNCPPTSKGVPKRINFTRRREKGVNIWNGYPSSVTLLFGRRDRVKDPCFPLPSFFVARASSRAYVLRRSQLLSKLQQWSRFSGEQHSKVILTE